MNKHLFYSFIALTVLGVTLTGCHSSTQAVPARTSPTRAVEAGVANSAEGLPDKTPLKLPLKNPRIEVRKADRKLLLFSDDRLVRTYHVGLGLSPVGDKERAGDRRTPEGQYYVFIKNPRSAFYLSLGISYPNLAHAERGLRDSLINRAQYQQIAEAIREKKTPPQRTKLGGEIFIHGHGASTDWTWGCVALENEDIKELYDAVAIGTSVAIKP